MFLHQASHVQLQDISFFILIPVYMIAISKAQAKKITTIMIGTKYFLEKTLQCAPVVCAELSILACFWQKLTTEGFNCDRFIKTQTVMVQLSKEKLIVLIIILISSNIALLSGK